MSSVQLGIARAQQGPAAAVIDLARGRAAACEENRLTRARETATIGPPDLATRELLRFLGRGAADVVASRGVGEEGDLDPHHAHATYAFHAAAVDDAVVLVCDAGMSVWECARGAGGAASSVARVPSFDEPAPFALIREFRSLTERVGLRPGRDEHLVEAMARAGQEPAASSQQQLGDQLVELLARIRAACRSDRLCLAGGLFFNTYFTTRAASAGVFAGIHVPPHPGRNGSALGAAMLAGPEPIAAPADVGSPFLGPMYPDASIKEALENCKLSFDLLHEDRLVNQVVAALTRGRLIGWYHGRLEWGPRALGHRSVLADPFSSHVLENLNGFLKQRPAYRAYGVSVPLSRLAEFFETAGAPPASPFMQFEYQPRDLDRFKTILPPGVRTLRVHTVDEDEPRVLRLLEAWGESCGTPVLVNTSFNGFHEPLVCTPRDAIRVFYGTGLDLLALEDFVLHK